MLTRFSLVSKVPSSLVTVARASYKITQILEERKGERKIKREKKATNEKYAIETQA